MDTKLAINRSDTFLHNTHAFFRLPSLYICLNATLFNENVFFKHNYPIEQVN